MKQAVCWIGLLFWGGSEAALCGQEPRNLLSCSASLSDLSSEDDMVEMSAWLRAKRALDLFSLWADILAITITFLAESKNLFVELISNVVVVSAGFLSMWD